MKELLKAKNEINRLYKKRVQSKDCWIKAFKNTSNEDLAEGVFRAQRDFIEGFAEIRDYKAEKLAS